ncbi:MAG TPA: helix-turn-helix domain-containing protein [Mycobacteriales bacterium]|nr:helix-turn-helix domain-containing protein [Mycobacteriales bacterium]
MAWSSMTVLASMWESGVDSVWSSRRTFDARASTSKFSDGVADQEYARDAASQGERSARSRTLTFVYGERAGIGERIRQLRMDRAPRLTQQELADRAGVSVEVIRKLEQGRRQTVLIGTLQAIARSLDTDAATLVSAPAALSTPEDPAAAGVRAIRRVVTAVEDLAGLAGPEDTAPSLAELRRSVSYAWGCYWASDYDALGVSLPTLVTGARAAVRDSDSRHAPAAHDVLAEAFQVTACLLVHLGHHDLAHLALERALDASARGDDALRHASLLGSVAWLLTSQGRFAESVRVSLGAADRCEPRISQTSPAELSVWGNLVLTGATAAARDDNVDQANDLLSVATTAATRIGSDRNDYQTSFGPSQVVMQSVDAAVTTCRFTHALETAVRMPAESALPLAARARHLTDVAQAQIHLGRDALAVDTLLYIERVSPRWMRFHALPQAITRELLERERRARTPRLRGLARRLGLPA